MCLPNNASMEETYKAEVECLRKVLAEKDKEIERLHYLLDLYDKEREEQEESCARWIDDTKEQLLRKAQ